MDAQQFLQKVQRVERNVLDHRKIDLTDLTRRRKTLKKLEMSIPEARSSNYRYSAAESLLALIQSRVSQTAKDLCMLAIPYVDLGKASVHKTFLEQLEVWWHDCSQAGELTTLLNDLINAGAPKGNHVMRSYLAK